MYRHVDNSSKFTRHHEARDVWPMVLIIAFYCVPTIVSLKFRVFPHFLQPQSFDSFAHFNYVINQNKY